jgi:hypothetical protein
VMVTGAQFMYISGLPTLLNQVLLFISNNNPQLGDGGYLPGSDCVPSLEISGNCKIICIRVRSTGAISKISGLVSRGAIANDRMDDFPNAVFVRLLIVCNTYLARTTTVDSLA